MHVCVRVFVLVFVFVCSCVCGCVCVCLVWRVLAGAVGYCTAGVIILLHGCCLIAFAFLLGWHALQTLRGIANSNVQKRPSRGTAPPTHPSFLGVPPGGDALDCRAVAPEALTPSLHSDDHV